MTLTLFRSSQFGDDQDRPMKKSDGSWTYFGADAAYHFEKARNADHLINIWGADHAGTVKRVQSAVKALTGGRVDLDVKLINMVRLFRGGEPVKMSKRAGDFVTLAEVVEEVGKDVVRFMMLTTRADARWISIRQGGRGVEGQSGLLRPICPCADQLAQAQGGRRGGRSRRRKPTSTGSTPRNSRLVRKAAQYPRIVESAAMAHEPHRIAFYLYELAAEFHALWNRGNDDPGRRFLVEGDPQLSRARLELALGIGQVIRSGLAIMGVTATEEMR